MRSLIVFSSQSGNTKKLAEAVAEVLPGEKKMVTVENAPQNLQDVDFLAIGFWLMGGKPDPKSSELLSRIKGKRVFLFATHGAAKGSAHATSAMAYARQLAEGAQIIGSYSCQGEVKATVIEKASSKEPPPAWLADASLAAGHPDEHDIAELKTILRSCL